MNKFATKKRKLRNKKKKKKNGQKKKGTEATDLMAVIISLPGPHFCEERAPTELKNIQ